MPPPVIIHQTLLRHSTPDGGAPRNQSWSPRELDQLERCQNLAKKMYVEILFFFIIFSHDIVSTTGAVFNFRHFVISFTITI